MASPGQSPEYYRPYLPSDSELSDADTESETGSYYSRASTPRPGNANPDYIDPREPSPDYKLLAEALNAPITLPSGPSFVTTKQEDFYATRKLDPRTTYHSYKQPTRAELEAQLAYESTITAETTAKRETVIVLQSRNRDKSIYPNPTACQLFLPRDYKRIVGFSIAQINLTSAFFYFSKLKSNVDIQMYEQNQIVYNCNSQPLLTPEGDFTPRYITNTIRDGSYNISQLLQELTIQLNKVPLFYDFINGFSDFLPLFQVNGDYSLNFNYPGDYYYDAVNKIYIQNPTRAQVTSFYFQSQYANLFTYTIQQVRVAYYYPVLKEGLLDPMTNTTQLNLSGTGLSTADTINYLLYQFQGINDPIATTVINNNIPWLDTYRLAHTFRYSLVNKYNCSYNATNNRVSITTPSLNTSLVNLLNAQYNIYLTQQLAKYQISAAQYATLAAQNTQILSILQSMYDYLQVQLAVYFAINYGTFSRGYYADSNNTILLRNGLDASGIAIRYDPSVAPTPRDTNLLEDYRTNPPYYWPRMKDLTNIEGAQRNMGNVSQPFPQSSNFPYSVQSSNINFTKNFIDTTGTIYTDVRTRAGDILVNVDPGKYTIFQFRSKYRQTLQVETLPRQTAYRYPEWNAACNVPYPIQSLFDVSYCYVDPGAAISNVTPFDISYNSIAGWYATPSTANFGIGYDDSFDAWGANKELINVFNSNGRYYTFTTPSPVWPKGSDEYVYNFSLTLTTPDGTSPFSSDLLAFLYHDIASFSADVSGVRHENPIHYKAVFSTVTATTIETTYTFTAYANQQYYLLLRSAALTPPSTEYRIVPWFPDGSTYSTLSTSVAFNPLQDPTTMLNNLTVAKLADPNYIRLPIQPSSLYGTNPANDPINLPLTAAPVPIGYDGSNVSNDLTDYVPFAPNNAVSSINPAATIRADPINNYIFQYNSPYSPIQDSYFYEGSLNAIYTRNAISQYIPSTVTSRQYKMVNWYSPNFIRDTATTLTYNPATSTTQYALPYTSSTTSNALFGYQYGGSNSALQLGTGVSGFTFLPTDGTWAIDRITFKTNFINPLASVNNYIHALGVFYTSEVTSKAVSYINLSNAIAICLRTGIQTYSNSTSLNIGFDAQLGSYYTYSNYPQLVTRPASNSIISGFAQQSKVFITDSNAYYSVVAFRIPAYSNYRYFNQSTISSIGLCNIKAQLPSAVPDHIQNLMGSPIAYPYANQAYSALTFYDGEFSPTGQGVVRSTSNGNNTPYGPPSGADESICQYEQSIPYVNSHLHYLNPTNIVADVSGFSAWSNLPTIPSYIVPSIPNHMLFQDSAFTLCTYSTNGAITPNTPASRDFTVKGQFAVQQIFPDHEQTSLIAVAGNTYEYCFLGAKNTATPGLSQLRFKTYSIATGIVEELPMNPSYTFCNAHQVQHFVYNDLRSWYLTSANIPGNYVLLQGDQQYSSTVTVTNISNVYTNNTYSELQMDPQGSALYFALAPTSATGFSTMTVWNLNSNAPVGRISTTSGCLITLKTGGTLPPYYKQIAVTLNDTIEEVLLTNIAYKSYKYYKIRNYLPLTLTTSNTSIDESVQNFTNSNNLFISPTRIFGGAEGSKWTLFDEEPYLLGNRNDSYDSPTSLNIAWQIFFPTMKIEMRKLTNGTSPIVDLTGITYPEWPHTVMFAYSNYNRLIADISGSDVPNMCTWGNESKTNFWVSDVSFNGFYFNSYMMNVPLLPNTSGGNYMTDYYIAVRGWLPTERFQTMMRFYLPNRYDFGFARIRDAEEEVFLAMSTPSEFNPTYLTTLLAFNSNFVFTNRNFGSNPTSGFAGSNLSSTDFKDYMTQYSGYFSTFTANTKILEQITSTVNASINSFVATDLQYVLPSTALTRQRFTDPLLFQIRWRSQLTPQFLTLEDQWGLGWNLGYAKQDTGFATIHIGDSFYKIQDDFIYLRLNPEFNINRMDAGGKENYKESREPSGFVNQYYCKLLLTSFGGNATTFIHNPIQFNPSIYKLSKMEFQWVDQNGVTITNADAEWDMVVNITEQIDTVPVEKRKIKFTLNPPFTPANPRDASPEDIPKDSELMSDGAEELQAKANQEAASLYEEERTTLEKEQKKPIMMNTQTGGVRPDYPAWLPAYDRRLTQQRLAVPAGATTQLEPAWNP